MGGKPQLILLLPKKHNFRKNCHFKFCICLLRRPPLCRLTSSYPALELPLAQNFPAFPSICRRLKALSKPNIFFEFLAVLRISRSGLIAASAGSGRRFLLFLQEVGVTKFVELRPSRSAKRFSAATALASEASSKAPASTH